MKKLDLTIICSLLCSLSTAAYGQEGDQKMLYEIGKDVARLEQEINDVKTVLAQILELDKQRVALLTQIVSGTSVAPSTGATPSHPSAGEDKPPAQDPRGTVTGKVRFPEDTKVAYVYVDNVRGRMVRGRTLEIAQKNKQFAPRWSVIQRGTKIRFPNEDTVYHNVFSRSSEAKFDLGIYRRGDAAKEHTFTQAGLVDVYCNMHSAMSAQVLVVPNHLFTKVASDGSFSLPNVPAGKRKVVVWSPGHALAERWISVQADGATDVSLTPGEPTKKSHLNKSGQPYGSYK